MSLPPIPPALDQLGGRPFSFYPAILHIEHNEWIYRKATWSEILVENAKTHQELWIPRRFLGEVSRIDDPVTIVGLTKELEYKSGTVWPHQRRVIELPVAVGERPLTMAAEEGARPRPAPVVGIRLEGGAESRIGRLIVTSLVLGVVACIMVVTVTREGTLRPRVVYSNKDQAFLELKYNDDIHAIRLKLGQPASERWRQNSGEIQYQALWYPQRAYYVVLMGMDRKAMHYIGAVDQDWNMVHSVSIPSGGTTAPLLRGLKNKQF
ncbi:MAG: hypothetical protein HYR60_00330 [Acidobacteria bacterium]|nr:hypothetical protein [Acidobacteriota bacterium]